MTQAPLSSRSTHLRAVPPQAPAASPKPAPPETPPSPKSAKGLRGSGRRWLWLGGTLFGLSCLSLLSVAHRVTGPGEVSATQAAVEIVSMPAPGGTVERVTVSANQTVNANRTIATLQIDSLLDRHTQLEHQIIQTKATLESRRQQITQRQAELREAIAQTATAQQAVDQLHQQVNSPLPEVQGWQGEIAAAQSEIAGLQSTLEIESDKIANVRPAVESGALSQHFFTDLQAQQVQIQNQIAQRQGQIAAKQAQINALTTNKQLGLSQAQATLAERQARQQSAQQAVQSAIAEYTAQAELLLAQETELQDLEARLEQTELLQTSIAGTVITPQQDIDQLQGRYLAAGEPMIAVMNPDKLTVDMWVRQEDRDLIALGMTAEFRPQSGRWEHYPAVVETIAAQTEFHETEQKPMLRVQLRLQAASQPLQLNSTGTARIVAEPMPIYQKVKREFLKVVPLQKLLAF